ncbi:hypothetical protein J1N35_002416 [Gossypium stocksii]|uniref:Uncharacterized protein n=1 Tax=Gossypium stocksii TaxID=47602 RepID=A0A9D3WMH2_9ROSI|nr:hypothetical protein J1N35_002416 [Gossypium stocksii]
MDMLEKMVEEVTKTKLAHEKEDRLIWLHNNKGDFSVKRMSNLLMEKGVEDLSFDFENIWCHPRSHNKTYKGLEMGRRLPSRVWLKFSVCGVMFKDKAGGGGVLKDEDGVA